MSYNDSLSDLIARIKNAYLAKHKMLGNVPATKSIKSLLDVLIREGYILSYEEKPLRDKINILEIKLKYYRGAPVIEKISRVSKPSRRVYSSVNEVNKYSPMLGVSILSTPQGFLSCKEAKKRNVGGEVVCQVF